MNLRSIRRSSRSLDGAWWDFVTHDCVPEPTANLCLLVAEAGNPKHRDALARARMARYEDFRAGGDRAKVAMDETAARAMSEGVLLDWANMEGDDGEPIAYSPGAAYALLVDASLWPLRHFVSEVSGIASQYRVEEEEQAKGN